MGLLYSDIPGSLAQLPTMRLSIGGAESNVAIALSRLGTSAAWIGRTGDDSLGERVRRELRAEGVDVHSVVDSTAPTGLMLKERRTNDSLSVYYYRAGSAGSRLTAGDIPVGLIERAAVLHVTGITAALSDSARETIFVAIASARAAGVPVAFDVNHRARLWRGRDPEETYRRMAGGADLVFAGEDEAAILVPGARNLRELLLGIAALGPTTVVIKLGAAGCIALIDGAEYRQDAVRISPLDTVGAGDAFVAGYLAEYVARASAEDRLRLAVEAGAFACLSTGDWEGLPRRNELKLLRATEPVAR
jgi:2-dehydro-3-deoxygluconokinase